MKKNLLFLITLVILTSNVYATIYNVTMDNVTINQYEKFEISFNLSQVFTNPYDLYEAKVYVKFTSPSGVEKIVNAFFYKSTSRSTSQNVYGHYKYEYITVTSNNCWKARFAPTETGYWTYAIYAIDNNTNTYNNFTGGFQCLKPLPNQHGFIRKANSRYLKFDDNTPYYPNGGNVYAWDNWRDMYEAGTIAIFDHIDSLAKYKANMMTLVLNEYTTLNLIGYDFWDKRNYLNYFNQRESWRVDTILEYAKLKGINVILQLFTYSTLGDNGVYPGTNDTNTLYSNYFCHGAWTEFNPFYKHIRRYPTQDPAYTAPYLPPLPADSVPVTERRVPTTDDGSFDLGTCENPLEFFDPENAARITQTNLINYIVARWSYATNILSFQIMDETNNIWSINKNPKNPNHDRWHFDNSNTNMDSIYKILESDWNNDMCDTIKEFDINQHLVSTAVLGADWMDTSPPNYQDNIQVSMDFATNKYYTNYKRPADTYSPSSYEGDFEDMMFDFNSLYLTRLNKPLTTMEIGYFNDWYSYGTEDPNMYEMHNLLWSGFFSGTMGTSNFWTIQDIIYKKECAPFALSIYQGIGTFLSNLPQLTQDYIPMKSDASIKNYRGFYLCNNNTADYYGWIQDTNFLFQSLNISDKLGYISQPSYNMQLQPDFEENNTFIFQVSENSCYDVAWYSTITGNIIKTETGRRPRSQNGNNFLTLRFPVTELTNQTNQWYSTNSIFGDVAFKISSSGSSVNQEVLALGSSVTNNHVKTNNKIAVNEAADVFFTGDDGTVYEMFNYGDGWCDGSPLIAGITGNVRNGSELVCAGNRLFYIGVDNKIHCYYYGSNNIWMRTVIQSEVRTGVGSLTYNSGQLFFIGSDSRIHGCKYNSSNNTWNVYKLKPDAPENVNIFSDLTSSPGKVFFTGDDNRIHCYWYDGSIWHETALNSAAPKNVKSNSSLAVNNAGQVFFIDIYNSIHCYYYYQNGWIEAGLVNNVSQNVKYNSEIVCTNDGRVYFISNDSKLHYYSWNNTWSEYTSNTPANVSGSIAPDLNSNVYYVGSDGRVWGNIYSCYANKYVKSEINSEIQSQQNKQQISILPNPTTGLVSIIVPGENTEVKTIEVIDFLGKVIMKKMSLSNNIELDLSDNPKGIYIFKVYDTNAVYSKKIILN